MSAAGQETEAKFYVRDLDKIRLRLEQFGARLIQKRVLETNLRFDLPGSPLSAEGRVLRLRRDTRARFTYKSASKRQDGALSREEIEFVVEDFDKAKRFLEALGYQKLFYYEKYRATYELHEALIMLDELPYGNFVEIEGETMDAIRAIAERLHLHWEAAIADSYHALFQRVRKVLGLSMEDLSFAEFEELPVNASRLDLIAADE